MSKKKTKKKKWLKFRHRVVRFFLFVPFYIYSRIKYGVKIERFREQGKRAYFILMNHQTAFDQFFVDMSFRGPIYYVASEDLFSKGWLSSLIRYLVEPIPIRKSMTDVRAVMNCMKVAKEGGTIAIAPEGNRTFSGRTEYIKPAIAALAKALRLPIAIYRFEGGFGVHPRYSDVVRRGRMRAYVREVIEPEEFMAMTDDALFRRISDALYYDEHDAGGVYRHKRSAEYMERVMYFCPHCGFSHMESRGDTVRCLGCGMSARYLPDLTFTSLSGDFPYGNMRDWYDAQEAFIRTVDPALYTDTPICDERIDLSRVIVYERKEPMEKGVTFSLYGDRLHLHGQQTDMTLPFADITAMTVLGRNKLNVYLGNDILQIKGDARFNPVKYMHMYYHYVNVKKGESNGEHEFLGL